MLKYLTLLFAFVGTFAYADTSSLTLGIPTAPFNYQSDRIRDGDLECQNAIGSATQLEVGVTGLIAKDGNITDAPKDIGVFARIVIPLGRIAKERIDCNALYEVLLEQKRLELQKLQREVEQLRALQFEN